MVGGAYLQLIGYGNSLAAYFSAKAKEGFSK